MWMTYSPCDTTGGDYDRLPGGPSYGGMMPSFGMLGGELILYQLFKTGLLENSPCRPFACLKLWGLSAVMLVSSFLCVLQVLLCW